MLLRFYFLKYCSLVETEGYVKNWSKLDKCIAKFPLLKQLSENRVTLLILPPFHTARNTTSNPPSFNLLQQTLLSDYCYPNLSLLLSRQNHIQALSVYWDIVLYLLYLNCQKFPSADAILARNYNNSLCRKVGLCSLFGKEPLKLNNCRGLLRKQATVPKLVRHN